MNSIKARTESVAKRCGRCGAAIREGNFCAPCREFFRALTDREKIFARAENQIKLGFRRRRLARANSKKEERGIRCQLA